MRSSRRLALALTAALAILVLAVVVKATAAPQQTIVEMKTVKKQPLLIATLVAEATVRTWRCQEQLGVPRTPVTYSPWKLGKHSQGFRKALLRTWVERHRACVKKLHAHDNVIRRLQQGLSGTPMDGSAGPLEAIARKWRISPYFIAAIAGTESSFGAAACSGNQFNAYGLSSCTTGWSVPHFRSWAESYEFMGRFLTSRWPNARTTYDYHGYAKNSDSWGHKWAFWMRVKFGVDNLVAYPN